jgi:toxin secretion/phage lysis holin
VASYLSLTGIFAYFGLNEETVIIFFCLLLIDFISGVAEAKVNGESITSEKAKKGVIKKLTLFILPFIVIAVMKGAELEGVATFCTHLVMGVLIASEGYSILGHIYNINTGKRLPEQDALTALVEKIMGIFKGKMEPQ